MPGAHSRRAGSAVQSEENDQCDVHMATLFVCLPVCLSVCLSVCLYVCLCLSVCLSVCLHRSRWIRSDPNPTMISAASKQRPCLCLCLCVADCSVLFNQHNRHTSKLWLHTPSRGRELSSSAGTQSAQRSQAPGSTGALSIHGVYGIGNQGRQGDCSIQAKGEDLNILHASLDYLL